MAQHSRGANPPESCERSPSRRREGAGNAGCPMHPQPRVRFVVGVCTRVFTAEAPDTFGIPHAMVLRLIRALPGDRALLPPSFAGKSRDLDASVGAPGPHAFAVRIGALVSRHQSVHRIPLPTSVTIAIRPSCGGGTAGTLQLIWDSEKAKYFFRRGLDTRFKKQADGQIKL